MVVTSRWPSSGPSDTDLGILAAPRSEPIPRSLTVVPYPPDATGVSEETARRLDSNPASAAMDGSVHGPACFYHGRLICAWPEQHDAAFTGLLADPQTYDAQPYDRLIAHPTGALADRVVTALAVAAGAVSVAIAVLVFAAGLHFQTVLSNSMRPSVSAGDVAVTETVPTTSLRVGDVIAFYPPNDPAPRLHRITSLTVVADGVAVTTRGDANPADDPWHATLQGTTAHRLVAVVPLIGWLTEFRGPALMLAGFLVGLVVLRELTRKKVELTDLTELSTYGNQS